MELQLVIRQAVELWSCNNSVCSTRVTMVVVCCLVVGCCLQGRRLKGGRERDGKGAVGIKHTQGEPGELYKTLEDGCKVLLAMLSKIFLRKFFRCPKIDREESRRG